MGEPTLDPNIVITPSAARPTEPALPPSVPMFEVPGFRLREMTDRIDALTARAERAEAAIQGVRALVGEFGAADCDGCNAGDIVTDILAALDSTDPEPAPEKKFVECQLPVGWEWCALRIGHAGECDPRPSAKEDRAANALTRPLSAGTYPDVSAPGRSAEGAHINEGDQQ